MHWMTCVDNGSYGADQSNELSVTMEAYLLKIDCAIRVFDHVGTANHFYII